MSDELGKLIPFPGKQVRPTPFQRIDEMQRKIAEKTEFASTEEQAFVNGALEALNFVIRVIGREPE